MTVDVLLHVAASSDAVDQLAAVVYAVADFEQMKVDGRTGCLVLGLEFCEQEVLKLCSLESKRIDK